MLLLVNFAVSIEWITKFHTKSVSAHSTFANLQAIMLVESVDGSKVLLGRAKTIRHASMLTCLSGFVEQVETIEEACRREVQEEAGIHVGPVHIAGSQPWPMGELPRPNVPKSMTCRRMYSL